jgi:threonine/homoserine/homoserine lactone efflux protein
VRDSFGVSAVVSSDTKPFTVLELMGSAYLNWIGVRTFQAAWREDVAVPSRESMASWPRR